MKPDEIDLEFLSDGHSSALKSNSQNDHSKSDPRLQELVEKAASGELVDLSLLLADQFSRRHLEAPPAADVIESPANSPGRSVDESAQGIDINEDALRLPLDLEAETEKAENLAPPPDEEMTFDANSLANFDFNLEEPETPQLTSWKEEAETEVEFESLPELDEPLILPPEPEAEMPVPPSITPEKEAALEPRFEEELISNIKMEAAPAPEPALPSAEESLEEPLRIFAKPAESSESKPQPRPAPKSESQTVGARPRPRPVSAALFSANFSLGLLFENTGMLGLDVGASAMKYIVLKKSARGLKLVDCGICPLPPLPVEASEEEKRRLIGESLQKHFKIKSFKNTLITSAVSGLEVFYQHIQAPKMARKELSKAVSWTCRKDFPFPLESAVFEYQILNSKNTKSSGKYDIFVIAAQEGVIAGHLEMLNHAQIAPAKISTLPVALWQLFKTVVKSDQGKCYAVLDIGGKSSHFVFIKGGQLLFAREIATGGDDFTNALTGSIFVEGREISVSKERAEKLKRRYGVIDVEDGMVTSEGIPFKEILVMMSPVLEKLSSEVRRTVDFVKEKFGVPGLHQIHLTGGGSFLKNLPAKLQQDLSTEVRILNPFQFISTRKFERGEELFRLGPRFATAVGLALDRNMALNLLPQKLKGAHAFQYIKRIVRYVFVILTLLMVWFSQDIKREVQQMKNEFQRINHEFNDVKPRRDKFLELQKTLNELKERTDLYNNQIDIKLDAANHLKAVSHLLPSNITLTALQMQYRQAMDEKKEEYMRELLVLEGVAFQNNSMEGINLARFLLDLERSNYFRAVTLRYQKIRDDGNLSFTLECEL